jgi:catechol 2,3-dioxygenase-like lactoylglutathione lyase family enzyme
MPHRLLFAVCIAVLLLASRGTGSQTTILHRVHLAVSDPPAAVAWYSTHLDGRPSTEGPDRLTFGQMEVIFLKGEAAPSAGGAIDHIGFSFADVDSKMKALETAGVTIVAPPRDAAGLFKYGFIEDPWDVRIAVVEDSATSGFHHIHLRAPAQAASLAWYRERFGGESATLHGRLEGLKYNGVWLLVAQGEAAPSAGRAVDHIGWRVTDLDHLLTALSTKGIKILRPPTATGAARVSFVEDLNGTKLELVQR